MNQAMTVTEFCEELYQRGYMPAIEAPTDKEKLEWLESDKNEVFEIWFGEDSFQQKLNQANYDLSRGFIKRAVDYIFMQEKINNDEESNR